MTAHARNDLRLGNHADAFAQAQMAMKLLAELGEVEEGKEAVRLLFIQAALESVMSALPAAHSARPALAHI